MGTAAQGRVDAFPFEWEEPGDAERLWLQDGEHMPHAVPPLVGELWAKVADGFNTAFRTYEVPIRMDYRRINGYMYGSIVPEGSPEEIASRAERAEAALTAAVGRLDAIWAEETLPEVRRCIDELEAMELGEASPSELAERWERTLELAARLWDLHFVLIVPVFLAISEFEELYKQLLSPDGPHEPFRLLRGFDNLTLAAARGIWELSRVARRSEAVRSALDAGDTEAVLEALEENEDGRAFLDELRDYLEAFGHRADRWDISAPSWGEDPTPVLATLRDYVRREEPHPAAELERAAAERERLVASARERLAGHPGLDAFDGLLAAAQRATVLLEDHGHWIDCRGFCAVRRVCLDLGGRFVEADALEAPEDVFHLTSAEIAEATRRFPQVDRRAIVAERRAELEGFRGLVPPKELGTEPDGPDPAQTPLGRAMLKAVGVPAEPSGTDALSGHPGSGGVARGRARVICDITDAGRLGDGDVLVTESTAPPWTPFFAVASAVVTDVGGTLSHCAVVAREYGIPAVVGTRTATATIPDGALVEVDGRAGTVRVVGD